MEHYNVQQERGKASTYLCEGGCQGRARDWAYVHGTDPKNVNNYVPLCRSCHKLYDGGSSKRFTDDQIREMRRLHSEGWGTTGIAARFHVTPTQAHRVTSRQIYKGVV